MMDAVAYCVENPGSGTGDAIPEESLKNCSAANVIIITPGGNVTLTGQDAINCDSTGSIVSGGVTASLEGAADEYLSLCWVTDNGFKCTVK